MYQPTGSLGQRLYHTAFRVRSHRIEEQYAEACRQKEREVQKLRRQRHPEEGRQDREVSAVRWDRDQAMTARPLRWDEHLGRSSCVGRYLLKPRRSILPSRKRDQSNRLLEKVGMLSVKTRPTMTPA
jgi:hypothetical protein